METEEIDIEINGIYIHSKTSKLYYVRNITKMKHPDTDKWIDCIIYESGEYYKIWVRSLDSFRSHFTLAM